MKNFKTYSTITAGLVIMMVMLPVPISESKGPVDDALKRLIAVTQMQAATASDEASRAVEKQRTLVKSLAGNGSSSIGGTIGGKATDDSENRQQPGRLSSREVAREKAVLQQLEANVRRAAEVRESVQKVAAEVERKQGKLDGISYLVAVTQMQAQTASDEALKGAEDQRTRANKLQELRARAVADIDKAEGGGLAAGDNKQPWQPASLTAREIAREKAVLQQLEANARRSAEVLESVKRLTTELDRQQRR